MFQVSRERLVSQCEFFNDRAFPAAPYTVCSSVPLALFRDSFAALNQEMFDLSNENFGGPSLLCPEFGFRTFSAKISEFRALPGGEDSKVNRNPPGQLTLMGGLMSNVPSIAASSVGFADRFGLSGNVHRIQRDAIFPSVAGQARWFQPWPLSPPLRWSLEHSDCDFGDRWELHRRLRSVKWDSRGDFKADDGLRSFVSG
jgi:hypothetical protein